LLNPRLGRLPVAFAATAFEDRRERIVVCTQHVYFGSSYDLTVRTGRYLAIVPSSIMRFPGKPSSIKALPVELPTTRRQIGIITLRNRALSPLAHIFIECARDIARRLAKSA